MSSSSIDTSVVTFRVFFLILPFVMGAFHCLWRKEVPGFSKVECFLSYFLVIGVGLQGILLGHLEVFHSEVVAAYIGFPNSPFLVQLGKANTAFGILGILCFWFKGGWRAATALGNALFLLMLAVGHFRALVTNPNHPITLELVMLADFLISLILIFLLILRRARKTAS